MPAGSGHTPRGADRARCAMGRTLELRDGRIVPPSPSCPKGEALPLRLHGARAVRAACNSRSHPRADATDGVARAMGSEARPRDRRVAAWCAGVVTSVLSPGATDESARPWAAAAGSSYWTVGSRERRGLQENAWHVWSDARVRSTGASLGLREQPGNAAGATGDRADRRGGAPDSPGVGADRWLVRCDTSAGAWDTAGERPAARGRPSDCRAGRMPRPVQARSLSRWHFARERDHGISPGNDGDARRAGRDRDGATRRTMRSARPLRRSSGPPRKVDDPADATRATTWRASGPIPLHSAPLR